MRFAGGRAVASKRNKINQEKAKEEGNNSRINKYRLHDNKANNSLDEIRVDFSK